VAMKESVMEQAASMVGSQKGFIILMLVGGTIAAFLIAIALYLTVSKAIVVSNTYTMSDSKVPILCTKLTTLNGKNIPDLKSGKRITLSWWMYINDLSTYAGQIRRVFSRGDKLATFDTTGIFVGLNDRLNKVHVVFRTTDASQYMMDGVNQATAIANFGNASAIEKLTFLSNVHGIVIDYVPMQRWVHLAVVINEESKGGIALAYVDGELVKTVTTSTKLESLTQPITLAGTSLSGVNLEVQSLDLNARGDIMVGGDMTGGLAGFSGLVTQIGLTNTDLNADDIYKMYLQGPIGGMAKYGLPAYGIQSPIYRLG